MQSVEQVQADISRIIDDELSKQLFNVVIFGYPGSGRGSQGKALAKKYGLEYVATGHMLEKEIECDTEIGKKVKKIYESGELVPDEIVVGLFAQKLENSKNVKGFIFKGFPRTLVQSYILDGLLKKHGTQISQILELEVPVLELISRLDERSKTDRGMPYDSSTAKIVNRLQEHEQKTIPVIQKYQQVHGTVEIDGTGTFEEVHERLSAAIETGIKTMR